MKGVGVVRGRGCKVGLCVGLLAATAACSSSSEPPPPSSTTTAAVMTVPLHPLFCHPHPFHRPHLASCAHSSLMATTEASLPGAAPGAPLTPSAAADTAAGKATATQGCMRRHNHNRIKRHNPTTVIKTNGGGGGGDPQKTQGAKETATHT